MDYKGFFNAVRKSNIELRFDNPREAHPARLSNEALFHLPLLAITILLLAKDRRKPRVDEIGQLIGECFERTFAGFKGSSQHLGWSANLRVRTVRALTFLETTGLVKIDRATDRILISEKGRPVIDRALQQNSELSYTLRSLERSYRNISVEKKVSMEL
jgi:hypothetical protein